MNTFISINDNFLNELDFEKYSKFSKETNMWGDRIPNVNWSGRVIFTENIEGFSQRNSLFLNNVKNIIKTKFEIEEEIYPDYLGVVKWEVGDMQHPHAGPDPHGQPPRRPAGSGPRRLPGTHDPLGRLQHFPHHRDAIVFRQERFPTFVAFGRAPTA